jgi:hypothetical protein
MAKLGEAWKSLSLSLSLSLKLSEAWHAVLCCAVLASGVSQLAKAVFLIFLHRQCKI